MTKKLQPTKVLLQAGRDVVIFGFKLAISFGCGQDKLRWAFVSYLLLLYLYSTAVGGRHSNGFPACSNTRTLCVTLHNIPFDN